MPPAECSPTLTRAWVSRLSGSISRDEFLALLFLLACVNGLGSQVIHSVHVSGWTDAILSTFGISIIVWISCFRGTTLTLQQSTEEVWLTDLVLGIALLVLIALPIGRLSWLAVTILGIYVLLFSNPSPSQRRGVLILLATTVPMLWSVLLSRYFASFILQIDASLIGLLLGTEHFGNVVRFADQSGSLVITPYCSSLANVSLAVLAWVTISLWLPRRSSPWDWYWCFLAVASVVVINVVRIGLMGLSQTHYDAIHNSWIDAMVDLLMLALVVGFSLLGVKRDFLARV
jgi:exosortase/archaeosortase family protein